MPSQLDVARFHDADTTGIVEKVLARLARSSEEAACKARATGRPVVAWTAVDIDAVDPVLLFTTWRSAAFQTTLWLRPDDRFGLVTAGSARTATTAGPLRFHQASTAWRALLDGAVGNGETEAWPAGPIGVAGFAFAAEEPGGLEWCGYPAGELTLPRAAVLYREGAAALIVAAVIEPDGRPFPEIGEEIRAYLRDVGQPGAPPPTGEAGARREIVYEEFPSPEQWKESVRAAATAVREGRLGKVVLARGLKVHSGFLSPGSLLRRLAADYAGCTIFAAARGERCFLGASPERLVGLRSGEVQVAALAGSAPRGRTDDDDTRLGRMMFISGKDWVEHSIVVESLRDALSAVCTVVSVDPSPGLLKVRNVQHLYTGLAGRLRQPMTALELAGLLHPTPAVGGMPRAEALEWIRVHEQLERGWYAGPIGWIDGTGDGEFAVAIRSALLRGNEALLLAGCGIVADSHPDREYAESWLKLRAVLDALHEA